MKRTIIGVAVLSFAGAACDGVDPGSPTAGEPVEAVKSELAGCSAGDANYTRVGDVNGDGRADLISPYYQTANVFEVKPGPALQWLAGADNGSWGNGNYTWAADFNRDGKTDLASGYGGTIYMKLSNFDSPASFTDQAYSIPNVWGQAGFTFMADFTGDGVPDIATATGGTANLFKFTPGVGFTTYSSSIINSWGSGGCGASCATPSGYTWAADFDGDGKADIASGWSTQMELIRGTGTGFTSQMFTVPAYWGAAGYTFVGHFMPGHNVIASASGGTVYMKWFDAPTQTFQFATWPVANAWGSSDYTWVGDFNGDGLSDIASANGTNVYMKLSTGTGFTSQTWSAPAGFGLSSYTRVGDFNGDGKADILTPTNAYCAFALYQSTGTGFTTHAL